MKVENYLLGYEKLIIVQNTQMFNFSLDSVLLPNFVTLNSSVKNILDIGCGNAPIPLILSTKTDANIVGVEIQKDVCALAIESVKINNLEKQIVIINDDIKNYAKKSETDVFDTIVCNPPYFKTFEKSNINESEYKTIARHEKFLTISDVFKVARKLLKNNGNIAIVHRPERLFEIMLEMKNNNIEPKKLQFVFPGNNKTSNLVLIEGVKNGKSGLKVMPSIISHKSNGEYSEEVKKFFK